MLAIHPQPHLPSHHAEHHAVERIVVPTTSMAHSAYGALVSDIHQSAERSLIIRGGGGTRDPWENIDCDQIVVPMPNSA